MAFTPPPTPPNSGDPGPFNARSDAMFGWFPGFVAELNAVAYPSVPLFYPNGTAAAPAATFDSDPDTGLFRKGANSIGFAVGGVEALVITAAGLLTSTTAITQSALDATPGRLQKSGDWGMGASYVPNMPGWSADSRIPGGLYQFYQDKDPAGQNFNSAVLVIPTGYDTASNPSLMLAISNITELNRVFIGRKSYSSATPTWTRLVTLKNILGTVSQTGGEVTGALWQPVTNANGRSERNASGGQRCTRSNLSVASAATAAGSRFTSANVTWTFPAGFLAGTVPAVHLSALDPDCEVRIVSVSATAVIFKILSDVSKSSPITVTGTADGVWSDMV